MNQLIPTMSEEQREAASDAWQAYNAMETTKQRHFDLLTVLETKKKNFNIDPTPQDTELLKNLLRDHDEQVKKFTSTARALKSADTGAHTAMFSYIAQINQVLGDARPSH